MQLNDLRYFAAVVDSGSISRAAVRIGISQPALTKCIRQLEQRLRVRLLDRNARGVTPTVYGHSLYVRAKSITAELTRAEAEIEELSRSSGGTLTIGVLPSQSMNVMPEASVRLTQSRPGLRIRIVEKPRADLIAGLHRGEFDLILSVIDRGEVDPAIAHKVMFRDRPAVVVRHDHPLAGSARTQSTELLRYPWVVPPPGSDRRVFIEQLFQSIGLTVPPNIIECHSVSFVKAVVMRSDYVGILPSDQPSPEQRAGSIRTLDLEPRPPVRQIGVLYRADHPMTEAAGALIRELQRAYSQSVQHAGAG